MYQLVCQAVQNISAQKKKKKVAFFLIVLALTVMSVGGIKNDLMVCTGEFIFQAQDKRCQLFTDEENNKLSAM